MWVIILLRFCGFCFFVDLRVFTVGVARVDPYKTPLILHPSRFIVTSHQLWEMKCSTFVCFEGSESRGNNLKTVEKCFCSRHQAETREKNELEQFYAITVGGKNF